MTDLPEKILLGIKSALLASTLIMTMTSLKEIFLPDNYKTIPYTWTNFCFFMFLIILGEFQDEFKKYKESIGIYDSSSGYELLWVT